MENVSTNCKRWFIETVLQIVKILKQNVFIKYVIVKVELNIV